MDPRLRTILVPLAFDATSDRSLELAVTLASMSGATIHVVHAIEAPILTTPEVVVAAAVDVGADLERSARRRMAELVEKRGGAVRIIPSVVTGPAATVILDAARAREADLIVIGTHGRHGLSRAILGSVAEKVVRLSRVPVLVVPAHD